MLFFFRFLFILDLFSAQHFSQCTVGEALKLRLSMPLQHVMFGRLSLAWQQNKKKIKKKKTLQQQQQYNISTWDNNNSNKETMPPIVVRIEVWLCVCVCALLVSYILSAIGWQCSAMRFPLPQKCVWSALHFSLNWYDKNNTTIRTTTTAINITTATKTTTATAD